MKWLLTVCLSPVVALTFAVAICGVLIMSVAVDLHQQLWPSPASETRRH